MSYVPDWWALVLLALAAFRVWRLLGQDVILDRPRDWLVRDGEAYRQELDEFIRCPWCLGFWVATVWWLAWLAWPHATLVVAAWWAIAAVVGAVAHMTND